MKLSPAFNHHISALRNGTSSQDDTSPDTTAFSVVPATPSLGIRDAEGWLRAFHWVSTCRRMANKAGIEVQSKRQKERGEEEIKLHILPHSRGCHCSPPWVQPATKDITARLVLPSVKTTSSSVLYKQQKQQKIKSIAAISIQDLSQLGVKRSKTATKEHFVSQLFYLCSSHSLPITHQSLTAGGADDILQPIDINIRIN